MLKFLAKEVKLLEHLDNPEATVIKSADEARQLLEERLDIRELLVFILNHGNKVSLAELYRHFPWLAFKENGNREIQLLRQYGLINIETPTLSSSSTDPLFFHRCFVCATWRARFIFMETN